jgi:hypothetical protein
MAEAVQWISEISPYACRRRVEEHFSVGRMTDDYLAAYKRISDAQPLRRPPLRRSDQTAGAIVIENPFGVGVSTQRPGHDLIGSQHQN